jgi:hypothetical protein
MVRRARLLHCEGSQPAFLDDDGRYQANACDAGCRCLCAGDMCHAAKPRAAEELSGSTAKVPCSFESFIDERTSNFSIRVRPRACCLLSLQLMDCIHVVSPAASARVFFDCLSSDGPSRASVVKADGVCDDAFSASLSGQTDWDQRLMQWLLK